MISFLIKRVVERLEKERVIRICDDSFPRGICKRDDYSEIFDKIDIYADFFVAYEEGEVCGYAAMYNNNQDLKKAYITMIGVRKTFQHKHIGSKLISACIDSAKDKGMVAIRLEVLKENTKAISFYKNAGFVYERSCSENSIYMVLVL